MKKWRRRTAAAAALLFLLLILALPARAAEAPDADELGLPAAVGAFLEQYGGAAGRLGALTPQALWERLTGMVRAQLTQPLRMLGSLAAVLLLAALARAAAPERAGAQLGALVDMAVILSSFLFACRPLLVLLDDIGQALLDCRTFLMTFVPVFAALTASCGMPASAALYTGFFLTGALAASALIGGVLVPLLKIYIALDIAGGLSGAVDLSGLCRVLSRFLRWALGLIATMFGAVLSLQSILARGADSVALRTGKFLVGSGVPVIGGAVADAIGTVYAGLQVVRGTAGVGAIVTVAALLLPLFVRCMVYDLTLCLAAALAAATGSSGAQKVFLGLCECIELYILILFFYAVVILLSTALLLLLGT